MDFNNLQKGDRVVDSWYPDAGVGTVIKKLKSSACIEFPESETGLSGKRNWDIEHIEAFLVVI